MNKIIIVLFLMVIKTIYSDAVAGDLYKRVMRLPEDQGAMRLFPYVFARRRLAEQGIRFAHIHIKNDTERYENCTHFAHYARNIRRAQCNTCGFQIVAMEFNVKTRMCYVYEFTEATHLLPDENTTSIFLGQPNACGQFFNPCKLYKGTTYVQHDPKAQLWTTYSCVCESACGTFDIPENLNQCPSLTFDFENNTNCPGLDQNFLVCNAERNGNGLHVPNGQFIMLGPFAPCTVNPFGAGCNITRFSVLLWLKLGPGNEHRVLSVTNETGNNNYAGFELYQINGYIYYKINDGNTKKKELLSLTSPGPGTWFHCVFIYNGTSISLYINGTFVLTSIIDIEEVFHHPDQPVMFVGKGDSKGDFHLDDMYIFPYALEENNLVSFQ